MRLRGWIGLAALTLVMACSARSPLHDMQAGEHGRVVRVIDGDALVLDTGQSVRLVGIEAPALYPPSGKADAYAAEARRLLEDLAMGREVQLYYPGLTRDRYDRALAHVRTADGAGPALWLNLEMLERGAARLRLYPDTDGGAEALIEAEADARADRRGLWAWRDYEAKPAAGIARSERGFLLVEGRLGGPADLPRENRRETLCARQFEGSKLVMDVAFSARSVCGLAEGTAITARGWVYRGRLELVHPLHVERGGTG